MAMTSWHEAFGGNINEECYSLAGRLLLYHHPPPRPSSPPAGNKVPGRVSLVGLHWLSAWMGRSEEEGILARAEKPHATKAELFL